MKLKVSTVDPHVRLKPSSTVVFGFACGSSRKASIKEFHQHVSLAVTTPLRMTGLEDCNFEIYITIPLRMTDLREDRSLILVIPTERGTSDEESPVYINCSTTISIHQKNWPFIEPVLFDSDFIFLLFCLTQGLLFGGGRCRRRRLLCFRRSGLRQFLRRILGDPLLALPKACKL